MNAQLKQADLSQFTGTYQWHRHGMNRRVICTDGVQYVAEVGKAYWLIDAIASYLVPSYLKPFIETDPRIGEMIFWTLSVASDQTAVLEARADSPCEAFIRQEIEFSDFPLTSLQIWGAFDGTHWVLYLPSEH